MAARSSNRRSSISESHRLPETRETVTEFCPAQSRTYYSEGIMVLRVASMFVGLVLACATFDAMAAGTSRAEFGKLPDGRRVEAVTLQSPDGISAVVINYGAALQSVVMADRTGKREDVALGYASLGGYLAKPEYFGATVGRFANRLAKGRFSLDGKQYQTPQNNNGNALHGGERGFDKVLWDIIATGTGNEASVTLKYVSPEGDQGYPGTLTAVAKYSLK